jgi:ASC-1-like (ASCH) protein
MVVGVKYYTSIEMRKLERRLEVVKNGLQQVKERLHDAQMRQKEVQSEESNFGDRMQTMKEIINDLQFRMSNSDDLAGKSIADSMPLTGF